MIEKKEYWIEGIMILMIDFTAFAVSVKTIAPKESLYQFGHAIWCERSEISLLEKFPPTRIVIRISYSLQVCNKEGGNCRNRKKK